MTPDIVVDVGNSRIKWGRCTAAGVIESVALPHGDTASWQAQRTRWNAARPLSWVVSGVHPGERDRVAEWVRSQGDVARILDNPDDLHLEVHLDHPEKVGIDRLLNAVAANSRRKAGTPALIVDAGSAVTVDCVDRDGAFCGGAIFPGFRLMSKALHDYTALLPLVDPPPQRPSFPATTTTTAVQAGIFWAVAGGVLGLIRSHSSPTSQTPEVFLTGGDAGLLVKGLAGDIMLWPEMTLEGIRLSAEALP
jgi:type III pantothenate kinase